MKFNIADFTTTKSNRSNFLVIILLGLATYVFHHSALSGFWRIDDGVHLAFAAEHSPWQYFFVPEITGKQSNYHFVTPWNVFFYDMNLWLFGLKPKWFYAHQLMMLWLDGIATFFLIRLWGQARWAFFGAILFLLGAPTVHAAQELMLCHYVTGLFFSILALICYVYAVRKQDKRLLLISAFFYLLATTCKEFYVPLIGILLFLPEGNFKKRLYYSIPFALVASMYVIWRYNVLGGYFIGGYNPETVPVKYLDNASALLSNFWRIPYDMLGSGKMGSYVLAVLSVISIAYFARNTYKIFIFLAGLVLILIPLIPMSQYIGTKERFFFLLWWAVSVYCSILFSKYTRFRAITYITGISMLFLAASSSYKEMTISSAHAVWKCHDAVTRFIINSSADQIFYDSNNVWYPSSLVARPLLEAEKAIYSSAPIRAYIISDFIVLSISGLKIKDVFGYNDSCQCVEKINDKVPELMIQKNIKNKKLFVDLKYENRYLTWNIGPYEKGVYKVLLKHDSKYLGGYFTKGTYPNKGSMRLEEEKAINFYIIYESPEGWSTCSELIHFELKENYKLNWSNNY